MRVSDSSLMRRFCARFAGFHFLPLAFRAGKFTGPETLAGAPALRGEEMFGDVGRGQRQKPLWGKCLARLPNVPHEQRFAKSALLESGKYCIFVRYRTKCAFYPAPPQEPLLSGLSQREIYALRRQGGRGKRQSLPLACPALHSKRVNRRFREERSKVGLGPGRWGGSCDLSLPMGWLPIAIDSVQWTSRKRNSPKH